LNIRYTEFYISDKQTKKFQVTDTDTGGVCVGKSTAPRTEPLAKPIVGYIGYLDCEFYRNSIFLVIFRNNKAWEL